MNRRILVAGLFLFVGCRHEPYDLTPPLDAGPSDGARIDATGEFTGMPDANDGAVEAASDTAEVVTGDGSSDGCRPESCNGLDDDCDSVTDNGFDFLNDPNHCGSCMACSIPNAIARCNAGACAILACRPGFVDANGLITDGCELTCSPSGLEVCDGQDNDCNGLTDGADPALVTPGNPCSQIGACLGSTLACTGAMGWLCSYPAGVELAAPGRVVVDELICDGVDGDCDGVADDSFPALGTNCSTGGVGLCASAGMMACSADGRSTVCQITRPGQAPANELCNNADDDCDGLTDEETNDAAGLGVVDSMVPLVLGGRTYWIYTYEAVRPDATSTDVGRVNARTCSRAGALPWTNVDWATASAACAASGKRLCTDVEWSFACGGAALRPYPYGITYAPNTCNGYDYDTDPVAPGNQDFAIASGLLAACTTPEGVVDLSGNLKEWTSDLRGVAGTPPRNIYGTRGGGFDNQAGGLRCDNTFASAPDNFAYGNLGFRCCSDTAP